MKGNIKFINKNNGWGFITGEDNNDVFFHISGFSNKEESVKCYDGCPVEYIIVDGTKGKKAVQIKIIQEKEDE